ncbi:MAG: N-acetylglucosamine-6-phosphate deacetylase [Gammaproteobacteria bacterium]|nr:N-acetylglucosamine-6-phosphate deacetylase [Gammaproteobacteria bacterium]
MIKAIVNGRVFDGEKLHSGLAVVLHGRTVHELLPREKLPVSVAIECDLGGHILAPGLIDIQVNGGGGVMFNDAPTVETIRRIGAAHRHFGTTGFLPTLISSNPGTMKRAIEAVDKAITGGVPGVLGVHLEGPFLNPAKRGIHKAERFLELDAGAIDLLTSSQHGCTLVTVAPETTENTMISRLAEQGVLVFGGHSAATCEEVQAALKAGMRGFTHLFNAMSPLQSRAPGMVGAALHDPDSWFGIIADGHHVHPTTFAVAVAAKRKGYAMLVSDAMASVGTDDGSFMFDGSEIIAGEGCCRLPDGTLAGSNMDMISAVRNTVRFAGVDPTEALRMASTYPAHALGLEGELGYIKPGFRASFIELDENLNLFRTWIDGKASA